MTKHFFKLRLLLDSYMQATWGLAIAGLDVDNFGYSPSSALVPA